MNQCCTKKKHRTAEEVKALVNRLSRIEGQIRGIKSMVENDEYCIDILNQISASRGALSSLAALLLETHICTCVAEGIKNGDKEVIAELNDVIKNFI